MTEKTFRMKMPTVTPLVTDPTWERCCRRPIICFKDDSPGAAHFRWWARCAAERIEEIKPDASPAMPISK